MCCNCDFTVPRVHTFCFKYSLRTGLYWVVGVRSAIWLLYLTLTLAVFHDPDAREGGEDGEGVGHKQEFDDAVTNAVNNGKK